MKLLTIEEAADRLAIAPVSLRRLVRAGRLPVIHPLGGRAVRFIEEDVERYVRGLRDQTSISGEPAA